MEQNDKTRSKKRIKTFLMTKVAPLPGALFVRAVWSTLRVSFIGREIPEGLHATGKTYIMAFWHGTLLMMVFACVRKRLTFLVSWHRDGELVTRVMQMFGVEPTRGSSTKGGARALQQLVKKTREGFDIAFTPDGPKGPAREVQLGVIQTAKLAGVPILPVGFAALKKKL